MRTVVKPDTLFDSSPYHFSQIITTPAAGTLVFLAGQAAMSVDGKPTGGGYAEQTAQALENIRLGLEAVGATIADLVSIRIYVVEHRVELMDEIVPVMARFFGDVPPPANTWIGIQALALPELKVEIEAQAVLSG